jgi:hypothetical protein
MQMDGFPIDYPAKRNAKVEAVTLDEHTRTVTCADPKCGAWSAYRQAMTQANEVAERVTVLKKEEQRLRAMVKRLQEKVPVLNTRGSEL